MGPVNQITGEHKIPVIKHRIENAAAELFESFKSYLNFAAFALKDSHLKLQSPSSSCCVHGDPEI